MGGRGRSVMMNFWYSCWSRWARSVQRIYKRWKNYISGSMLKMKVHSRLKIFSPWHTGKPRIYKRMDDIGLARRREKARKKKMATRYRYVLVPFLCCHDHFETKKKLIVLQTT